MSYRLGYYNTYTYDVVSSGDLQIPDPRAAHAATGIPPASSNQWKGWLGAELHNNSSLVDVSLPMTGELVSRFGVAAIR